MRAFIWISAIALAGAAASAADLSGTWSFERTARDGTKLQTLYIFKADGAAFTGLMVSPSDRRDIVNGKVDGNEITFDTKFEFDDSGRLTPYKGEIAGDSISILPVRTNGKNPPRPTNITRLSADTAYHMPAELEHKPFAPFQPIAGNGLAKTPPMGWNSWNKFAGRVDDKAVREIADAMVSSGMRDAGYIYVNIDDTWEGQRDAEGNLQSNQKFPDMKALAAYVHSKGLKLGIYSGPGPRTCAGFIASYNHEEQDARTWAAWGIDYLKYDWCSASAVYHRDEMQSAYQKMALALRATGRPIIFSLCQYGWLDVGSWGAQAGGNLWRTTGDISDRWESMSRIGFGQNGREKAAGPGHWNDPDMLEIGNGGMSDIEYRTHMTLWSMLAAPLLAGNDIRSMSEATRDILTNRDVIAIDQDPLGAQGFRVRQDGDLEIWKKPLAHGTAFALFNRGDAQVKMVVKWKDLGVEGKPKVRDLWSHKDVPLVNADEFADFVPAHGSILLRVE